MHIIIGGAYNGKRQYVENLVEGQEVIWCHSSLASITLNTENKTVLVVSGIEKMFENLMEEDEVAQATQMFETLKKSSEAFNKAYIILVDRGRGIVPIDAEQRKMRDVLGRLYQLLMKEARTVTRIWYGIPQQIK